MTQPAYDAFLDWLRDRFGDDLRWMASFNSETFDYEVRYVREDLKTDLSSLQLEYVIHRSMAVYNRDHLGDVYRHLGDAQSLVVQHERAMAVHLYFDDARGVVVKVSTDATVTTPTFTGNAMAVLFPGRE